MTHLSTHDQAQPDDETRDAAARESERERPGSSRPTTVRYAVVRAVREFMTDQCTDLAAALVYYSVLAIVPALIALVSILGVLADPQAVLDDLFGVVEDLGSSEVVDTLRPVLEQIASSSAAGWGLVLGLLTALWSASAYVTAFSRAANRVYGVEEGRPVWRLRPTMYGVTLGLLVMVALIAVMLVASGDVVRSVGTLFGEADTLATVWSVVRWPVVAVLAVLVVAMLYLATPNVRHERRRWITPGAATAIIAWALASGAFGLYVSRFASYDATYGTLAGFVVFLLALWIGNLALLFGIELDVELRRARQLRLGLPAERDVLVRLRDTRAIEKRAAKERELEAEAAQIAEAPQGDTPEKAPSDQ